MITRLGSTCTIMLDGMDWKFKRGETREDIPSHVVAGLLKEDEILVAKGNKPSWKKSKAKKPVATTPTDVKKDEGS